MCLYPRLVHNPKYKETKKNGGLIPAVYDTRVLRVPIGCGNCIECRKQKGREWQLRMMEDIKTNTNGKFITLTISNESIKQLWIYIHSKLKEDIKLTGYELDNQIATTAVRLWLERWRKKYKKSIRHWLITELGHNGTENIHLHGILWTNHAISDIRDTWSYGWIWPRQTDNEIHNMRINSRYYVNERTVNYIIKYITKRDEKHKTYKSIILTSPGIGRNYTETAQAKNNQYNGHLTNETYKTSTGHPIAMPTYWRNKLYNDKERERLWLQKLDKQERWVCGEKVNISTTEEGYYRLLEYHRKRNKELGYGTDKKEWSREKYEQERRNIMLETRIRNSKHRTPSAGSIQKGLDI